MAPTGRGAGQTALVTGASGGIGLDLAECFARDGYGLVLAARSEAALKQQADRLAKQYEVSAVPIAVDLGAHGSGQRLADEILARGLAVDVLVNNAGYGKAGAFAGSDAATQLGMIDLNVRALVELTHAFWPRMLERRRGGVLNVASTAAFQPGPLMAVYYASKAFVLSFSEALWREAQGTGVHVSCLCPGPTATGFRERAGTGATRLSTLGTPVSSMSVAEEGYRAFQRNQRVLITGARNRIMARLVPYLPRRAVLDLAHRIQSPL
jgi:short-subunit dehydrogenase